MTDRRKSSQIHGRSSSRVYMRATIKSNGSWLILLADGYSLRIFKKQDEAFVCVYRRSRGVYGCWAFAEVNGSFIGLTMRCTIELLIDRWLNLAITMMYIDVTTLQILPLT